MISFPASFFLWPQVQISLQSSLKHHTTGCVFLWVATYVAEAGIEPICRRTCNASYVLWVAAHNASAILVYLLAELAQALTRARGWDQTEIDICTRSGVEAASLRGNEQKHVDGIPFGKPSDGTCSTGAVNISVDTLNTDDTHAICILAIYMAAVCFGSYVLSHAGISLRLPTHRASQ
eukprot:scaffold558568_cov46-Prasinocladus_malaysianus.AAC.1